MHSSQIHPPLSLHKKYAFSMKVIDYSHNTGVIVDVVYSPDGELAFVHFR